MAEAIVKLSVADAASARLNSLSRELKELAVVAKSAGSPDSARLAQGARQLQNVATNFGMVRTEAAQTAKTLDTARSAMGAFTSSAGLGFAKSLIGLGGAVAFAAAAGKVIGDSIKLAAQFERVSQRATFSLALGQGNLVAQLNALKQNSGNYAALGIDKIQATEMIGTYGQTSGATLRQSIAAGSSLAQYSRAMGMDPTMMAQQMGLLAQYAGKNNDKNSAEVFGAARSAGDAGRRPTELLGNVVSLLSQMQASNPTGGVTLKNALSEIVGVTKLGGYYQTQAGMQSTIGGYNAIGHSVSSNPYLTNIAMRSGWSIPDIMFGSSDSRKLNPLLSNMYKATGGNQNILASVVSSILPGDQGKLVFEALMKNHGHITSDFANVTKKALAAGVGAYQNTPEGQMAKAAAEIKNAEISIGDAIIKVMVPKLATVAEDLNNLATGLTNLHFPESMKDVGDGLRSVANALIATAPQNVQDYIKQAERGADKVVNFGGNVAHGVANFQNSGNSLIQGAEDIIGKPFGLASDQIESRQDTEFQKKMNAGQVGGPWDTKRLLYAIRMRENSGKYTGTNSIGAMGAYQFMPDTLMGGNDEHGIFHPGYAQSMSPKLLKRLGRAGFSKYFVDHPEMQDRYMGAMLQNAIAYGVTSPAEYGAYHLGGGGGFDNYKYKGRGDNPKYGDGSSTLNQENRAIYANYLNAPDAYRQSSYRDSAAMQNANHPAHHNDSHHGGGNSSTKQKLHVGNNVHVEISAKVVKSPSNVVGATYR